MYYKKSKTLQNVLQIWFDYSGCRYILYIFRIITVDRFWADCKNGEETRLPTDCFKWDDFKIRYMGYDIKVNLLDILTILNVYGESGESVLIAMSEIRNIWIVRDDFKYCVFKQDLWENYPCGRCAHFYFDHSSLTTSRLHHEHLSHCSSYHRDTTLIAIKAQYIITNSPELWEAMTQAKESLASWFVFQKFLKWYCEERFT